MPYQPAVLGTARLNNFRLNYLTAAAAADRPTHVRISIGGIDVTRPDAPTRVIYKSITITDVLFDEPNTCQLTLYGAAPTVGQRIEIWINSDAPVLLFAGELQTVQRTYKGRPATVLHPVTAIDDTAWANKRRPLMQFVNTSASTVAAAILTNYVPECSAAGIEPNLPAISITLDGSEGGVKGCLTAIAKLIGGYWYFENKTLYLFRTPPGPAPDPIDDTPRRFLDDPAITWAIDKSQVRTRVYGKGASTRVVANLDVNSLTIPVENIEMFRPYGGQAIVADTPDGAAFMVIDYSGIQPGGGGGLVGTGAAPSGAPGLALAAGAGVETGTHGYAVTFQTAAGESLAGPVGSITVGPVAPPSAAPVAASPTSGGAIDAGTYTYAVTFATAAGETTGSLASNPVATVAGLGSVTPPGTTTAALRNVVGNLANGVSYRYETTITIAGSGETLPGAAGTAIIPAPPAAPPAAWTEAHAFTSPPGNLQPGNYWYGMAYVIGSSYETQLDAGARAGSPSGITNPYVNAGISMTLRASPDARVTGIRVYRTKGETSPPNPGIDVYLVGTAPNAAAVFTDQKRDAELGAARTLTSPAIGTPPGDSATVTIPTSADGRAIGRKVYRSDAGAPFRYLTAIANNTATSIVDNTASVATQPDAPTSDTTGGVGSQTVLVTGIATGGALVTSRKLYRAPGGGNYQLVTTIANNTATSYTDTKAQATLGAILPSVATANANQVTVTVPTGQATVTGRKLYRTAANLAPLKLLQTIANNTTTAITDAAADATLGAAPPVVDTSGLAQPSGQVAAGATTLIVANAAPFDAGGGWAVIGNGEQVIRYAGKTATSLTGIPATGSGAITASISFNSTVTAAPALTGVVAFFYPVIRNSPIYVWVERDDIAAQAAMITMDGGGNGVYEHIWSDERRSVASLEQVCDAQLALYSRPIATVTYASRDLKTKSGKTVTINVSTPAIHETLMIQQVTITEIGIRGLLPKFTVQASTVRQSLESILQMLLRKADA